MIKSFLLMSLQTFCEFGPQTISNIMIGHLPNDPQTYLAGVGLARTFANVLGASIAWGFTSGLYTLIPQAIGSKNKALISIYTQRSFIVTLFILIPLSIIQFFGGDFMCLIGEPYHLKYIINNYCRWLIPYMFAFCWLSILQRIMQSLDLNFALWIIILIGFGLCYPILYFIMYTLNWSYLGAALAQCIIFSMYVKPLFFWFVLFVYPCTNLMMVCNFYLFFSFFFFF